MRLRPVRMSDANTIVWLRNQDYVRGKVGDSAPDIAGQEAWLKDYFQREGDYYFMVETLRGIPLGTHGLYNLAGTTAESGRYIIRQEAPAAVPSSILVYDLAFECLGLRELLARCVSTNHTIHSLNRKFGFKQTETVRGSQVIGGRPVDLVHFVLKAGDWLKSRKGLVPMAQYAERQIRDWQNQMLERDVALPAHQNSRAGAIGKQLLDLILTQGHSDEETAFNE